MSGLRVLGPWDRVVRALGPDPARVAPLFAGLSVRDARRVLAGAQLRELPADTQLIGADQDWRALWLVLGGELMAASTRGGVAVPLAKLGPGDVVGLGAEPAPEPCDVVTLSDAKLLRISGATLAQLRRRRPRLAARVDGNLSRTRRV